MERARVVIVGGGFAGAATAYALVAAGVRDVCVVEREPSCGHHASGRNAALGRQLPSDDRFAELAIRGAAFLRRPPYGFADTPLLSSSGSILLCGDAARLAALQRRAAERGLPHGVVSSGEIAERWPLLEGAPCAGGVAFPTDGVIDIAALLDGFLAGARAGGARVVTGCEVLGVAPDGGGEVAVATTRGELRARAVVVAAGAWAGQVGAACGADDPGLDPVRRHLHLTEPLPGLDPTAPFAWRVGDADEFYVRPESGAALVSGCDETVVAPCEPAVHADAVPALADRLARAAPRLAELGLARSWACLRTFTRAARGRRPLIGWDERVPWLFWVAALGGHGATASAAIGAEAAAAIAARVR